jgi:hypothetical protein
MKRSIAAPLRGRGVVGGPPLQPRARWSSAHARRWAEGTPWLIGCNFTPSTASNQLELWQESTFDPETIDRELGWAAETLGLNSIRLFLHDLLWTVDGQRFLDRIDKVLAIADSHEIRVMPVLFDGIWDPNPRPGPQRAPKPGIHNSTWVQGPGAAVLADRSRWPTLRPYVEAVLERYGEDPRVVVWDLFNEPDSPNPAWARWDPPRKPALVAELLELVFDWAAAIDPVQPLTVGIFEATASTHPERVSRVTRTALERSDVISFHSYSSEAGLNKTINRLEALGRPLLCTEWLGRPRSPVALARTLHDRGVGAWMWGLVDGRTQTRYPWTSWLRPGNAHTPWFHELLHADGSPYDAAEAALLRSLSPRSGPTTPWNCSGNETGPLR